MKGGHVPGETVADLLLTPHGETTFEGPRLDTRHTHGTGCTLGPRPALPAWPRACRWSTRSPAPGPTPPRPSAARPARPRPRPPRPRLAAARSGLTAAIVMAGLVPGPRQLYLRHACMGRPDKPGDDAGEG
ncbi:MAG: bifunctional hydroxymethylpyrimidine kinase/phosphomethylpyrimidine kinase [Caulobacteraceae bacterium]